MWTNNYLPCGNGGGGGDADFYSKKSFLWPSNIFLFLVILLCLTGWVEPQQFRYNKQLSKEVTTLLDDLLHEDKYDRRFRPNFGGPPVKIQISMYIKSLGPVSETEEDFSMDLYFRQMWTDSRLKFNASTGLSEFSLNWLFLEKVWKPDTFFVNGKKSYLHSITVPNKFLRLRQDGFLTYSMRLTIKAKCAMQLRKFPLDSQSCPLEIGSYGYSNHDVQYQWSRSSSNPVGREEGVNLAQYNLVDIHTTEEIRLSSRRDNFSVIAVHFNLQRATGFYLLQVYVPCALIVSCSWVSFWLDPAAVPARVSLGVTTVLSISTLGFGNRSQMPRTSYATALDWFVIMCFSFVFASMIEYAAINFIEKMNKDVGAKAKTKKSRAETKQKKAAAAAAAESSGLESEEENRREEEEDARGGGGLRRRIGRAIFIGPQVAGSFGRVSKWFHKHLRDPWALTKGPAKKVSKIDHYARRIFPLSFTIFNLFYWTLYLYYIVDDDEGKKR